MGNIDCQCIIDDDCGKSIWCKNGKFFCSTDENIFTRASSFKKTIAKLTIIQCYPLSPFNWYWRGIVYLFLLFDI